MSNFLSGLKAKGFLGVDPPQDRELLKELEDLIRGETSSIRQLEESHSDGLASSDAVRKISRLLSEAHHSEAHLETFLQKMHGIDKEEWSKISHRWKGQLSETLPGQFVQSELADIWRKCILRSAAEILERKALLAKEVFKYLQTVDASAERLVREGDRNTRAYRRMISLATEGLITCWPVELFNEREPLPGTQVEPWDLDIFKVLGRIAADGKWKDGPWHWQNRMLTGQVHPRNGRDWELAFAEGLVVWLESQQLPLVWPLEAEVAANPKVMGLFQAHQALTRFRMHENIARPGWIPTTFDIIESRKYSEDRYRDRKEKVKRKVILRMWLIWMRRRSK